MRCAGGSDEIKWTSCNGGGTDEIRPSRITVRAQGEFVYTDRLSSSLSHKYYKSRLAPCHSCTVIIVTAAYKILYNMWSFQSLRGKKQDTRAYYYNIVELAPITTWHFNLPIYSSPVTVRYYYQLTVNIIVYYQQVSIYFAASSTVYIIHSYILLLLW